MTVGEHDGPRLPPPKVLREYALLADGERGCLVGPEGECAWLCFPRWDSDPVFCSMLGARGCYVLTPSPRSVWGGHYETGSLIWRSRWITTDSIVESREALALPSHPRRAVLLRRVVPKEGRTPVLVRLDLRRAFGSGRLGQLALSQDGSWTGRLDDVHMRWTGAASAQVTGEDGPFELRLTVEPGSYHDLVLELSLDPLDGGPPDPGELWSATEESWQRQVPALEHVTARRDARHAFAVLRGLTMSTGAMMAAATTSLPERADAGRNYDYRYAWMRDQCFAGEAMAAVGGVELLDAATRFVRERILHDGPNLRPVYRGDGTRLEGQETVDIPGYPGAPRVMVGNQAGTQFQLDVFGEALLLFASAARLDRVQADDWRAVDIAASAIDRRWREPDAGVWETKDRHWTSGRLLCAAGLRQIATCAPIGASVGAWLALADRLTSHVAARCVDPTGRWQRAQDDTGLDASLLLAQIRGAVAPGDPRAVATRRAIADELSREGYVYRFRSGDEPLGQAEGAFLLCNHWMALAAWQAGEREEAIVYFERARAACGPPGLYCEEYDVEERQLRGNLPQAFVHALLLECAGTLSPSSGA